MTVAPEPADATGGSTMTIRRVMIRSMILLGATGGRDPAARLAGTGVEASTAPLSVNVAPPVIHAMARTPFLVHRRRRDLASVIPGPRRGR
jgi:hypothetical protein